MKRLRLRTWFVMVAFAVAASAAIVVVLRYNRPRSLIKEVISNPVVHLKPSDTVQLRVFLRTHEINSAKERKAFCTAVVDRTLAGKDDLLIFAVLPAWSEHGWYAEVWEVGASRIRDLRPGADSLLGHLADTDTKKARSVIDFRSVFERSKDEYLIAMALLVMDQTVADTQAKSLDVLLNRPDVSDRVKDAAKKRLQQLADPENGIAPSNLREEDANESSH